jgi:pyruvate carboxylase
MEIGANIPGKIVKVLVEVGDVVEDQQPVAVIEAMKMETNIIAKSAGKVEEILVKQDQQVKAGELIAVLK